MPAQPADSIKQVLLDCQDSPTHHDLLNRFYKIYKSIDLDEFVSEFLSLARYPMTVYAREPCVEKTILFLSKAVTHVAIKDSKKDDETQKESKSGGAEKREDEEMHPLLSAFFDFLLNVHSAKERGVRFRCCQLITNLLNDLGTVAHIEDDLYDRIYRCMVERMRDKFAQVRVHAVLALTRLQDPTDETCPIVKAYMILMAKDPSFEVRRAVLTCIAPSSFSLAAILERTRDIKDTVRQTAYTVIAEKIPLRALTIQQRVDLLQSGLNDRSEKVQTACSTKLLQGWLVSCQGSALELLERLDAQSSVKICEKALAFLFSGAGVLDIVQKFDILGDSLLMPEEKQTGESVFYWKSVVEYVKGQGHEYEEHLDKIRPNCVDFCVYIKKFSKQLKSCTDMDKMLDLEFIMEQFLSLLSMMDLSDTASRKATEKLTHDLLVSDFIGPSLVAHIMPCLRLVQATTEKLINYVVETISEIREPITQVETALTAEQRIDLDKKIAGIRVKINELRQELSDSIEKQDFEKAAQLKNDISELDIERSSLLEETQPTIEEVRTQNNDPLTILKCLTIACELLVSPDVKQWSPQLQEFMESQIIPCMMKEEQEVRNVAVRAIGLCCHIKKEMIMQQLPLLLQATQVDTTPVRVTALRAIFDIIHINGLDTFNNGVEQASQILDQSSGAQSEDGNQTVNSISQDDESASAHLEKKGWSETASKVIAILSESLNSDIPELRCVSAEGLAKLILSGRVVSPKLLSHMILLWFNPLMEDDEVLSQVLGHFFPLFAFSSSENQQLVEESFMPTLRTLTSAPATSPLSEVNEINVANFMVELTDARHLVENVKANTPVQENPCHDSLALKLCNEVLSHPDCFAVKVWLKALTQLVISPDNKSLHKDLFKMSERIAMVITEKPCLKLLEKFRDELASYDEPTQAEEETETLDGTSTCGEGQSETESLPEVEQRKGRKSVQTPIVPNRAATNSRSVRKSSRQTRISSALGDAVFATPGPRAPKQRDALDETRQDLENLMLEHRASKTPLVAGTPKTPKRPLHSIQDPAFTE